MASKGKLIDKIHDQFLSMFSLHEQHIDRDKSRLTIEQEHLKRWRRELRLALEPG